MSSRRLAKRRMVLWGAVGSALVIACAAAWTAYRVLRPDRAPSMAPASEQADAILVEKAARRLTLLRGGAPIAVYRVALGSAPVGHKQQEGDGRTPEGRYAIDLRNARSSFHLSLRISYPSAADSARAASIGTNPGGWIMIHGQPTSLGGIPGLRLPGDWTDGCLAVSNPEMEEIWRRVPTGTPVEIRP